MMRTLGPLIVCAERGNCWFRLFGYGAHYLNTRHHRELFSSRNHLGSHRYDLRFGPLRFGPLFRRSA